MRVTASLMYIPQHIDVVFHSKRQATEGSSVVARCLGVIYCLCILKHLDRKKAARSGTFCIRKGFMMDHIGGVPHLTGLQMSKGIYAVEAVLRSPV